MAQPNAQCLGDGGVGEIGAHGHDGRYAVEQEEGGHHGAATDARDADERTDGETGEYQNPVHAGLGVGYGGDNAVLG